MLVLASKGQQKTKSKHALIITFLKPISKESSTEYFINSVVILFVEI